MKFQEVLVIFSAVLVLITAENKETKHGQDHLQVKSHQSKIPQNRHVLNRSKHFKSENQRSNHFRSFIYRDGNKNCSWVCPDDKGKPSPHPPELQVDYDGDAGLIRVINKTSNIALVFDGHLHVAVIINGQSGVVTVIDVKPKLIYRTSDAKAGDLIDACLQDSSSLQALLNDGQQSQEKYNFSSINPSVLSDLSSLGWSHSCSEEDLDDITSVTTQLEGPLASIYQNKGSFNIPNAQRFVSLNVAFGKLLENNQESLQSLHVQFDLGSVFGANSGIEALVRFLTQIGKGVDLSKLLFKCLSSPEDTLHLILDVSKSNDGIDGRITVLAKIIDVVTGKGSISEVVNALMNFNPDSGNSSDLLQIAKEVLDLIRSQNASFQNFPAFREILKEINNHSLVWHHINISDVINVLKFQNPRKIMQTVMKIISTQDIPQWMRIASSQGIPLLMKYIKNIPDFENILQAASKGNISQILSNVNVTSLLSNIPMSGDIVHRISSTLGNGFGHFLNSSPILLCFKDSIEGNSTSGLLRNILGTFTIPMSTFTNEMFEMTSGIEHGIGGLLGSIKDKFLESGSGHGGTSESTSENWATSSSVSGSTSTGGSELDDLSSGFEKLFSNRKMSSHGNHNLQEKKDNKLHHNLQEKKPEHEHLHH